MERVRAAFDEAGMSSTGRFFAFSADNLPRSQGCCTILLAAKNTNSNARSNGNFVHLRDAFPYPVRWVDTNRQPHHKQKSKLLPSAVKDAADYVLDVVDDIGDVDRWELIPWEDTVPGDTERPFEQPPLNQLRFRGRSGFAPLAVGLYLAAWGGSPDPHVLGTGKWIEDNGIGSVDRIQAKYNLARELGARILFLPSSDADRSKNEFLPPPQPPGSDATDALQIRTLPVDQPHPRDALREFLNELFAEPDGNEKFHVRKTYFLTRQHRWEASRFYVKALTQSVAAGYQPKTNGSSHSAEQDPNDKLVTGIREKFNDQGFDLDDWRPELLVTTVSRSFELVGQVCDVFRPKRVLVFGTEDLLNEHVPPYGQITICTVVSDMLKSRVCDDGPLTAKCYLDLFVRPNELPTEMNPDVLEEMMPRAVDEFRAGIDDPQDVLFDITPGFVLFAAEFLRVAQRGNRIVNIRALTDRHTNRAEPGTEIPHLWEVETPGVLHALAKPPVLPAV